MTSKRTPAKLRPIEITNIEQKPWQCPVCKFRFKTKGGLAGHFGAKHQSKPVPHFTPSAREGNLLQIKKKKAKTPISSKRALDLGRKKGQKIHNASQRHRRNEKGSKSLRKST